MLSPGPSEPVAWSPGPSEPVAWSPLLWVGRLWCKVFHSKALLPFRGAYRCAECLRIFPSPWA